MFFCLVYGYKNRNWNFLRLNKNFFFCSFPSFMASKTNTGSFYGLTRPLFLFLFMVLSNKGRDFDETLTRRSFCFAYSYKIHNRVSVTKTALTKLLENTLDESSKIKNMSVERLEYPTKSLLSQNFYWTISDLLKTLISHPGFEIHPFAFLPKI